MAELKTEHAWAKPASTTQGEAQASNMVHSAAGVVTGKQRSSTPSKFDVCDQDLANNVWAEERLRWSREQSFKMALLCQFLGKSRIGEQDSGDRRPHRELESRTVRMIPTALRAQVTACMQTLCESNGSLYVPLAMAAKVCIIVMSTHGHRTNLIHLFLPALKLRGATLIELEEARTVEFRSLKQFDANGMRWFFHTLRNLFKFMP